MVAYTEKQAEAIQLTSQPFPVRGYKRIAVKVVDVFGKVEELITKLGLPRGTTSSTPCGAR